MTEEELVDAACTRVRRPSDMLEPEVLALRAKNMEARRVRDISLQMAMCIQWTIGTMVRDKWTTSL